MGVHDEHLRLAAAGLQLKAHRLQHLGQDLVAGKVGHVFDQTRAAGDIDLSLLGGIGGLDDGQSPLRAGARLRGL